MVFLLCQVGKAGGWIVLVVFNVHIVHCGGWSPYGVFPSVAGRKIPDAVFVDSGLFPLNALSKNQV